MTRALPLARLRRRVAGFGRNECGAAAASYVLMLPVVFGLFLLTLDSGFTTMRAALLDRSVDMTARSIRNGTLATPSLENIKTDLCSRLTFFPNCATQLKVQLVAVPRADFATPARTIACADQGASLAPVRAFVTGQTNPLAVLRACMTIVSFTPAALIANRPLNYSINASAVLAAGAS